MWLSTVQLFKILRSVKTSFEYKSKKKKKTRNKKEVWKKTQWEKKKGQRKEEALLKLRSCKPS